MADSSDISPPKKKKLPFKPTALRRAAQPTTTPTATTSTQGDAQAKPDNAEDDDGLDLFRRSKEMAPIMAADRERRLLKKQRQQQREAEEAEERERERKLRQEQEEQLRLRRASAGEKRRFEEEPDDTGLGAVSPDEEGESSSATLGMPGSNNDDSPAQDNSQPVTAHGGSFRQVNDAHHTRLGESKDASILTWPNHNREPVTPPPSKRSRHASTPSQGVAFSPDRGSAQNSSPVARIMRSHAKPGGSSGAVAARPGASRTAGFQSTPVISLDSDSEAEPERQPEVDDDVAMLKGSSNERQDSLEIVESGPHDGSVAGAREQQQQQQTQGDVDEEEEEDEFAEYERKAAEQRARDLAEAGKEQVDIIVTSDIPGAHPAFFKFLFNKPLRLVRDSWFALQLKKGGAGLAPDQQDGVVLTWRRKRVYNASTLLSIGIRPDAAGGGRVAVEGTGFGSSRVDGLNGERTRVHMEAWTPELFQKMEAEAEQLHRRRLEAGEDLDDDDDRDHDGNGGGTHEGPGATDPPPPEVKLRVILKARGLDDVKLTVRPETTVETLVAGFRAQRPISGDNDVSLWFDGERLPGDATMADVEIDDMDTIDVHVKAPVEIDD